MVAVAVVACAILAAPNILAVGVDTATSSNALKISPVRADIEVKPGERKSVAVTLVNLTNAPIAIHPVANDFISSDERGTPSLILDETSYAPTHSLKRFIAPVDDVTISAGQAKVVDVAIAVPADAQAGGYFGAIRFTPSSLKGGGQVNLSASVVSLILLTVPGNAVEKLELTDFSVRQNGTASYHFDDPDNLQLFARFENKGNLQVGPFGKVSVKSGNKVIYEADFNNNNPREVVLPDGARRWDVPLDNIGSFGNYTVTATFTYGKNNQTIEATKSFWILPLKMLLVIICGVVLLVAAIIGALVLRYRHVHRSLRFGNRYR